MNERAKVLLTEMIHATEYVKEQVQDLQHVLEAIRSRNGCKDMAEIHAISDGHSYSSKAIRGQVDRLVDASRSFAVMERRKMERQRVKS